MDKKSLHDYQLTELIMKYPEYPVDIEGVIVDYMARSDFNIYQIFDMNQNIYNDLFLESSGLKKSKILISYLSSLDDIMFNDRYPKVEELVLKHKSRNVLKSNDKVIDYSILSDPSKYFGHSRDVVVWQLSDLHFGKFNKLNTDPAELAAIINMAINKYHLLRPDIVIVSGDVTSESKKNEYKDFLIFLEKISLNIWGKKCPERMLVVPGNHDVKWGKSGAADKMKEFRGMVASSELCLTPFGSDNNSSCESGINIKKIHKNENIPPMLLVEYEKYDLDILLLVSGYYSGKVPEELLLYLKGVPTDENFKNILRVDYGDINIEYISDMVKEIRQRKDRLRLAVMHHNPIQYGREICKNMNAPLLLENLASINFPILLHGHVHMHEELFNLRNYDSKQSYPIPCPTLTSICSSGGMGFNIHVIGKKDDKTCMTTAVWEVSNLPDFKIEALDIMYKFVIDGASCEMMK